MFTRDSLISLRKHYDSLKKKGEIFLPFDEFLLDHTSYLNAAVADSQDSISGSFLHGIMDLTGSYVDEPSLPSGSSTVINKSQV